MVYGPINQASTVGGLDEIRRTTAPTRRASSQRSTARRDSANATIIPPTNERQSTTNEKSSHPQPTHLQSNSKPINLNGDDQGDHAIARTGRVTAGGNYTDPALNDITCGETNNPGDGEKIWTDNNKDAWRTKGAAGTISKGGNHR